MPFPKMQRIALSVWTAFTLGFVAPSASQAALKICAKPAGAVCGQCESGEIARFDNLVSKLEASPSGPATFESVLDLAKGAVPSLFKNPVFVGSSQSLQGATPAHPRVILKSTEGEVLLAYATDPKERGGQTIESITWDAKAARFRFTEILFDTEKRIATVHRDPPKCLGCHAPDGGSARPNWDAYNFWGNQIPARADRIVRGSTESRLYVDIYKKVAAGEPRFAPLEIPADVKNAFASGAESPGQGSTYFAIVRDGSFRGDNRGPGARLFDQISKNNVCRISEEIRRSGSYDRVKYAAVGALMQCPRMNEFFDEETLARSRAYFASGGLEVGTSARDLLTAIEFETRRRQRDHFGARAQAQAELIASVLGSEALAMAEISKNLEILRKDREDIVIEREKSSDIVAPLRAFLEPEGIPVSGFSLSFAAESYTFGDFLAVHPSMPIIESVEAEYKAAAPNGVSADRCDWLAQRSRDAR